MRFSTKQNDLCEMLAYLLAIAEDLKFSKKDLFHLELAAEELLQNIIEHAYGKEGGDLEIEAWSEGQLLKVQLTDWAQAFNPLVSQEPLLKETLGGRGITLFKQLVDEASYQRKNGSNCLCFSKKQSSS